jgi:enoyl-CoA hydratase/carnithine racemase
MGNEERITAATALRLGLVTEVVPREELRGRARAIASSIARRNPKAIQGTIRAIWESLDMTRTASLQNGVSYTLIGNFPTNVPPARDKSETEFR